MRKDKTRKLQKEKLKKKLENKSTTVDKKIETIEYGKQYYENVESHQIDE